MAAVSWKSPVSGNWNTPADWSAGRVPGTADDVTIGVAGPYLIAMTTAVAVHSITVSDLDATLSIADPGAAETVAGNFANSGTVRLDAADGGGTNLKIGAALSNSGLFTIGNAGLAKAMIVTAASLANTGEIDLTGGSAQATLDVTGATPATLTGDYVLQGNALLEVPSASVTPSGGSITAIAGHAELVLDGAAARVGLSGATTTNSGLAGLASNAGTLAIQSGSKIATGGAFANNGLLEIDNDIFGTGDAGGSSLAVAGVLTNRGDLDIGNSGLTSSATVSATGLVNTAIGTVSLTGGTAQAGLTIAGAAPATLTGFYYLQGDALLQFGGGHITSIAANSVLRLDGAQARLALAGNTATNSALTSLAANNGLFELEDHAAVAVTARTVFNNFGSLEVDTLGGGGSRLTLAGTLDNVGSLAIGGSSLVIGGASALVTAAGLTDSGTIDLTGGPGRATLDILGAALPTVTNAIDLTGNALLEFGSGSIATIASGGSLDLDGANARVALNSDPTTSGALAGLANNFGDLELADGAAVTTTVGLANSGEISVDSSTFSTFLGDGGSSLTIGGTLANFDTLDIGNSRILAATTVTAGVLSNSGFVNLTGNTATQATLNITAAAPPSLTGSFDLAGDALLEFNSGGVTAIGAGASLFLDGALSRVALAATPGSNSALTGLASNAGTLSLADGAAVTTKVALANTGTIELDTNFGSGGGGLALGGVLTNGSSLDIGNTGLAKAVTVTAPGLVNSGTVEIAGGVATQATLHITGAAPATLVGSYSLSGDALLEYNSGGVTAIGTSASGGAGSLTLDGAKSLVALASAPTTDSALIGLATNNGTFALENGASPTTKVGLTNNAPLQVDFGFGSGGGGLTVGGALTNNPGADIDIGNSSLSAATGVSAASLANAGGFTVASGSAAAATLKIAGGFGNTDTVEIDTGFGAGGGSIVTIGGTLTNSGNFYVGNTTLAKSTTVTAAGLVNTDAIDLTGGATAQAKLGIAGAAPTTLAGSYNLAGDALLEFGSGGITAIGAGASLTLIGALSRVALAATPGSNSALTGLATNAGTLVLENGASLAVKTGLASTGAIEIDEFGGGGSSLAIGGALSSSSLSIGNGAMTAAANVGAASLANAGTLFMTSAAAAAAKLSVAGALGNTGFAEIDSGFGAVGGSIVMIGKTLTNSDTLEIGASSLAKATTVTAAGLVNTGAIELTGGATAQAKLGIAGAAPVFLAGTYTLSGDALLEFGSGGITAIGSGASLTLSGQQALVALAGKLTIDSALTGLATNAGTLTLENGAALATTVGLTNSGSLGIDSGFGATGGSALTIGGTLANSAFNFTIGNASIAKATTVTAAGLANTGAINLTGGASSRAALDITAVAPATLAGNYYLIGDALLEFAGGGITGISGSLTLDGAQALIALAGKLTTDSALTGLATNTGTLTLENGAALTTTTGLANSGTLDIDAGYGAIGGSALTIGGALTNGSFETIAIGNSGLSAATTLKAASLANAGSLLLTSGAAAATLNVTGAFGNSEFVQIDASGGGGSRLAIGGTLTNSATFEIGNSSLTKATTASAAGLVNTGAIDLTGGTAAATLDIAGVALATLTGSYDLTGDALLEFASGGVTAIGSGASLTLNGADALMALASKPTTNSALAGLASNAGTLTIENGALLLTTTALTNSGNIGIDSGFGETGGSSLTIGGAFTSGSFSSVVIGNSGLTKATTVTAAGLADSGTISLTGGTAIGDLAALKIAGTAAASLAGTYSLSGDALLQFASGGITTIGSGASLTLNGADAVVALASKPTTNSALTGLASSAGSLSLENGAALATTTALAVGADGGLAVDNQFGGGSSLTIGGALTNNSFNFIIGNSGLGKATTVTAASLANSGSLALVSGTAAAVLKVAGAFGNTNVLAVDTFDSGGSSVTVGGTLTNSGTVEIGNAGLTTATTVTAAALADTGTISLTGGTAIGDLAALKIAGTAAASLAGTYSLSGDALLQFASGGVTAIASGASLTLNGGAALMALAGKPTMNSALTGLASSAGSLSLENGAALATTVAFANSGTLDIDNQFDSGGSSLTIGGALTNSSFNFEIGNSGLGKATTVTAASLANSGSLALSSGTAAAALKVAGAFGNTNVVTIDTFDTGGSSVMVGGTLTNSATVEIGNGSLTTATTVKAAGLANTGTIDLAGGTASGDLAALKIAGAGPASLAGTYNLSGDALLEFASGGVTAIASGASLMLSGPAALVALASKPGTNSALSGLASNAGSLSLENGAALATTVAFANSGTLAIDNQFDSGGSSLATGGALTNSSFDTITIGNTGLTAATKLVAASLTNDTGGNITVSGSSGDTATLSLGGASTDAGSLTVDSGGVLALGNTLTVSGSLTLDGGTVSGGTLATSGTGTLETGFDISAALTGVTIGSGSTFTAEFGSTLTVSGVTVSGALNGSNSATLDFAKTGTDSLTNVSGFATIGLASGAANTLTLAAANFGSLSMITVNDGNSGNTVDAHLLSASNAITVHAGTGADVLTGGAGNDVFVAGGDTAMTGNAGANQFTFEAPGASNTIADFAASSTNELVFSNAGFNLGQSSAGPTPQALPVALFTANATGVFGNTSERLAYDTANGKLFASANGSGSTPQLVATLSDHAPIAAATQLFFIS